MRDLARGLLAPIIVFSLLMLVGWFVIDQTTDSALILDQSVTTSEGSQADPFAEPADPFAEGSAAPAQGQIQTYLDEIADGLFKWVIVVTGAGAICALFWFLVSMQQQKGVVGPTGQPKSFPLWVGFAGLYAVVCALAYFQFIDPLRIDETMDDGMFFAFVGLAAVFGLAAYWVATAVAASPVMKPSVPLAARKARG